MGIGWKSPKLNKYFPAVLLGFLPLVSILIRCGVDGRSITDVWIPTSPWNDELFYYKLTEAVVHFGYPQGYFGFNESHGLILSFAAWSPVLLLGGAFFGKIFSWGLLTPIFCNVVMMGLALFYFGLVIRPPKKQLLFLIFSYLAFTPMMRYALSAMPEMEMYSLFTCYFALAASEEKEHKKRKLILLFLVTALLTWMRPYLLLFMALPSFYLYRLKRKKGILCGICVIMGTMGVYGLISHYFSAPYLTDLYYTDWITTFFQKGILAGIKYFVWKLYTSGMSMLGMVREAIVREHAAGLLYLAFLLGLLLFMGHLIFSLKRKKTWKYKAVEMQLWFSMFGFLIADLLMYRIQEGGRHTQLFLLGCILMITLLDWKWWEGGAVFLAVVLLFVGKATIPYEHSIPYSNAMQREEFRSFQAQLEEKMHLNEQAPSYENTVIWALWDEVDGKSQTTDYAGLYALPKGFGISLCDGGYVDNNLENMKSRYLATSAGGIFAKRAEQAGAKEIGGYGSLVIYDRKKEN